MNEKTNEIIKSYLNNRKTDYALLLSGPWGCGKTFYVTNELKTIVENEQFLFIYISLYGVEDFDKIKRRITFRLLYKRKSKNDIDVDLIDGLFEISSNLPKVGPTISILKQSKTIIEVKKLKDVDLSNVFFVFDDLERISKKAHRGDFMGLIYENYIKKGGKTIFVTDEEKIKDKKYKKVKEKVIRRTISYEPEFNLQFDSFINTYNFTQEQKLHITKLKVKFINYLLLLEIRNLRTIAFIFDNYFEVINKLNSNFIEKHGDFIFTNIMILTNEFINGAISLNDIKTKKGLNEITKYPFFIGFSEKKDKDKSYAEKFYEKYNLNLSLNFVFVAEIFNFILTGYLEIDNFKKEISELFDDLSEIKLAQNKLRDFRYSEEKDLIDSMEVVIKYSKDGYYLLSDLPYLYTLLMFLKEKGYIESWSYNVEEIINNAFTESEKNPEKIPTMMDIRDGLHPFDPKQTTNMFYNDLVQRIKDKANEKNLNEKINKLNQIFDFAQDDNPKILSVLRDYRHYELYNDIENSKLMNRFFDLNNKGISFFESQLHYDILRVSNAGEHGYSQKSSIENLIEYLEGEISDRDLPHMRKIRLKEFIDELKKACVHLENTKK
ncbi:MAG: P-loop NTPase fold protein [Promethearchaeota archaeon]